VNWNILVTLGKKIKRDSMISVNENRIAYGVILYKYFTLEKVKRFINCLK